MYNKNVCICVCYILVYARMLGYVVYACMHVFMVCVCLCACVFCMSGMSVRYDCTCVFCVCYLCALCMYVCKVMRSMCVRLRMSDMYSLCVCMNVMRVMPYTLCMFVLCVFMSCLYACYVCMCAMYV